MLGQIEVGTSGVGLLILVILILAVVWLVRHL